MALIGTLVSFSAGTKIISADVNSNFTAIRNAFNSSAMMNDLATTITVTHIFSVSQDFAAGIITSGASSFGGNITVVSGNTVTSSGVTYAGKPTFDTGFVVTSGAGITVSGMTATGAATWSGRQTFSTGLAITAGGAVITAGGLEVDAGGVGIGVAPVANTGLFFFGSAQTGADQYQIRAAASITVTATNSGTAAFLQVQVPNLAFTVANVYGAYLANATKGASASITTGYGLYIEAQTKGSTADYGIYVNQGAGVSGNGVRIAQTAAMIDDGFVITGGSLTGSTAKSLLNLTQTWNTSGAPDGILLDVTNTASTGAHLINLKVGGTSKFSVDVSGNMVNAGTYSPATIALTTSASAGSVAISIANDTTSGFYSAGAGILDVAVSATRCFFFQAAQVTTQVKFKVNGVGASTVCAPGALATSATTGYIYIPTFPSTGTGVPATETGTVALAFNTGSDRLMVYNAGWKTILLS